MTVQDTPLAGPQLTARDMADVVSSHHPDTILCVRTPDGLRPIAGETGCDLVAPPARPAETEPAGEIVVNIEPDFEAFSTKLAAELAQPAWRHPFLVTRDKIEQAFRELLG